MSTAPMTGARAARETMRLAVAIADEEARCHIECNCLRVHRANAFWLDTSTAPDVADADEARAAAEFDLVVTTPNCLRYLDLRDMIVRHPTKPHLVRFVDRIQLPTES